MTMWLAFVVLIISLASVFANDTTHLPDCSVNEDCDPDRACKENKCVNPCATLCGGANTLCLMTDHMAMCACRPGYSGHPLTGCNQNEGPECTVNEDCDLDRICTKHKCINPCTTVCDGANTVCDVTNHFVNCACRPGYSGNPRKGCSQINPPECTVNEDCDPEKVCTRQKCVNPCTTVCDGANSVCYVTNHFVNCACRPGYSGNPRTGCSQIKPPECTLNEACSSDKVCLGQKCVNPCSTVCGALNTTCDVTSHVVKCACRPGYTGHPDTGCSQIFKGRPDSRDTTLTVVVPEMSEEMQKYAVDTATQALKNSTLTYFRKIAVHVHEKFDQKYNPHWNVLVGSNYGIDFHFTPKNYIYFKLGKTDFVIWRCAGC